MPLLTWGHSPSLALRYADVLLQSDDILYKTYNVGCCS